MRRKEKRRKEEKAKDELLNNHTKSVSSTIKISLRGVMVVSTKKRRGW